MKAIPRRQSRPLVVKDNTHIFGFSTPEQANKFCKWAKRKTMDAWTVGSKNVYILFGEDVEVGERVTSGLIFEFMTDTRQFKSRVCVDGDTHNYFRKKDDSDG